MIRAVKYQFLGIIIQNAQNHENGSIFKTYFHHGSEFGKSIKVTAENTRNYADKPRTLNMQRVHDFS